MAYKIEVLTQALVITDTVSGGVIFEVPKGDYYFKSSFLDNDIIEFYNIRGQDDLAKTLPELTIGNSINSGDVLYTVATFRTFARTNLGFKNGGGIGGGDVDSVFGRTGVVTAETSDYTAEQVAFTPVSAVAATNAQEAIASLGLVAGNSLTTGVFSGGLLTANVDPTKFDVSDGIGLVVDAFTDPSNPLVSVKTWGGLTGITPTFGASDNLSWIGLDASLTVIQQDTEFTSEQRRSIIVLGNLVHIVGSTITATNSSSHETTSGYLSDDLAAALGDINIYGNNYTPASTDLTLRKEAGRSFRASSNRSINTKDPNFKTSSVADPVTFLYAYNDGLGGVSTLAPTTSINPLLLDDNSGTLGAVPSGNRWTNQFMYFFPGSNLVVARPGEVVYSSFADAEAAALIIAPTLIGINFGPEFIRTVITVKRSTTDLSDNTEVLFSHTGKFGLTGGVGGGGGGTFQDLQDVYGNSVTPEISTDATRGALTLKENTGNDAANVYEGKNNVGSTTFHVRGDGRVKVASAVNTDEAVNKAQLDAAVLSAGANPNITRVSTLAELQAAPTNATVEIIGTINCAAGDIDVSTKNFTLKDGGGLITNFNTFDLGNFKTDGNPNATFFDQSYDEIAGTVLGQSTNIYVSVTGQCLDEIVYVNWFSPNKNADLIVGGTLNGALPDHIAFQNAIAVTPKDRGTISLPCDSWLLKGDGTNPDYLYTDNPYTGNGNVEMNVNQDDYIGANQSFVFEDYNNLTILGNDAIILDHPDQTNIVNNRGFYFVNCDNLKIYDITYDGNLQERDPYNVDRNPFNIQYNFGFLSCNNPVIERITSQKSVMDGIYFGAYQGVTAFGGSINDCNFLYNYRQGMSVVSHSELTFTKCKFSFTGRLTSTTGTADGRWLTTSPSAGVDMEAGGVGTSPDVRGQFGNSFYECVFEGNYGDGFANHWGSTGTIVDGCTFIKNSLFEPLDSVEETTGNNTYTNNTFRNSFAHLEAGGAHFIGNIFYQDEYLQGLQALSPPYIESAIKQLIIITDNGDQYINGFARQTIVKDNFVKIEAQDANFATTDVVLGRITLNAANAIFEGNTIVNALGITDVGGVSTMADIGNVQPVERIYNNEWKVTSEVLAKYTGNLGRLTLDSSTEIYDNNEIHDGYSNLDLQLKDNNPGVDRRGSFAVFSSYRGQIDGDEAYDIYVPNDNGDIKITVVGGDGLGNAIQETWFSTYDLTYRKNGHAHGNTESNWYFRDPVLSTNPNTSNAAYKIVCKHDVVGNTNYQTQLLVEWFGQDGELYRNKDFVIIRNTNYADGGTFRRVYDGGLRGTTANIPTTGGIGNYTEINEGADYYDTTTNSMKYWDGAAFS